MTTLMISAVCFDFEGLKLLLMSNLRRQSSAVSTAAVAMLPWLPASAQTAACGLMTPSAAAHKVLPLVWRVCTVCCMASHGLPWRAVRVGRGGDHHADGAADHGRRVLRAGAGLGAAHAHARQHRAHAAHGRRAGAPVNMIVSEALLDAVTEAPADAHLRALSLIVGPRGQLSVQAELHSN